MSCFSLLVVIFLGEKAQILHTWKIQVYINKHIYLYVYAVTSSVVSTATNKSFGESLVKKHISIVKMLGPGMARTSVPWSKVAILEMVIPPLIGNPYNGYINPYSWVDDHPLLYGNNGNLDPSTSGWAWSDTIHSQWKRFLTDLLVCHLFEPDTSNEKFLAVSIGWWTLMFYIGNGWKSPNIHWKKTGCYRVPGKYFNSPTLNPSG